ncbi:MAG: hypothetical protein A2068_09510 [Ignavibacteria bacterium GWB2_35_6b]|nr:MAG: hypothetical protein A2068_09510 [Ignavibacteria bacterium GWB2_35_6b]
MKNTITILSIIKKQDEEKTKGIFKNVIEKFWNGDLSEVLKIGKPNQIPNQLLFALEVPKTNAVEVIKQLTYEGVAIVKNDPSIKTAVNEANFELENQQASTIQRIKKEDALKNKLLKKGEYSIEELAYLKDWQLMVDVALNQSFNNIDKSRKIKELLPEVLNEAIEKEIELGTRSLGAAKNSIEKLVAITENETLKRFHFTGSIRKAGHAVINFCKEYPKDLIGDLIFLSNSSSTIPEINVKSFLAFYNVIKDDLEKYDYEIIVATRHINTRALDTVHSASVKLDPEEKKLLQEGIEFFKKKRLSL